MASKRFYCTICKKVKRVRRLPANTKNAQSLTPESRKGTCDKHAASEGTSEYVNRIRAVR